MNEPAAACDTDRMASTPQVWETGWYRYIGGNRGWEPVPAETAETERGEGAGWDLVYVTNDLEQEPLW